MKLKTLVLSGALCAFASTGAFAAFFGAEGILTAIEGTMVAHFAKSLVEMKNTAQEVARTAKAAARNLKDIKTVTSWEDFNDWAQRQQYLVGQTDYQLGELEVELGGALEAAHGSKTMKMKELLAMVKENANQWKKKITGEFFQGDEKLQWLASGLSPSNFAYLSALNKMKEPMVERLLARDTVVAEENKASSERNKEILDELAKDARLPAEDRMGETQLAKLGMEVNIDTNEILKRIYYEMAESKKIDALEKLANEVQPEEGMISPEYNESFFKPLDMK
jgi:hypothetical protein